MLLAVGITWFRPQRSVRDMPTLAARPGVDSIKIDSGSTRLALANFGSVVLEGPAEFEMLGPMRARLHRGRIKVRITDPQGHGFVLETPNGEVTDLGTEFGVDVSDAGRDGLVVFEGAVDLRVRSSRDSAASDYAERLVEGEGVVVNQGGQVDRIMAIFTGRNATFGQLADSRSHDTSPIIVDVRDNLRTGETRKFYAIVPQGFGDDVRPYVDRSLYEWNAVDEKGMPAYLLGADYIRPFNNDKMRKDFELHVTLSRPARLFVIFDDRVPAPAWLTESFADTGDDIGMDLGPSPTKLAETGVVAPRDRPPGILVDHIFSVWECQVVQPGTVTLGPNSGPTGMTAMYGIAAVALEPDIDRPNFQKDAGFHQNRPDGPLAIAGKAREHSTPMQLQSSPEF